MTPEKEDPAGTDGAEEKVDKTVAYDIENSKKYASDQVVSSNEEAANSADDLEIPPFLDRRKNGKSK